MGYEDERVIVDVREGERGRIIYKDGAGEAHTYYPARHAYFVVEDLEILVVLNEPPEGLTEPVIVRRIRGMARLEDRGLSVVGDPNSKTHTVAMSFEASDWRPRLESVSDEGMDAPVSNFLGGATLGFNPHDWEIGNDDWWWIACYLPKSFVQQLEDAIVSGHLASVRVGLALRGLYSDEGEWSPAALPSNLFIRPNRRNNDVRFPELADGFVSSILFTTTRLALRAPCEPQPAEPTDDIEPTPPQAVVDPVSEAIAALAARVEATRGTIKWVGGFIIAALLFVAIR